MNAIISTKRLNIRMAKPEDADFYEELWNEPQVMKFVGYPKGLQISNQRIIEQLQDRSGRIFNATLVVVLRSNKQRIGETKMDYPIKGEATTDVKLLPQFWGKGYGTEIKRAIVDYLFSHTDAQVIKASPNKLNIASQKMQLAVGARLTGEGVYHFPKNLKNTVDVEYLVYKVFRKDWKRIENEG